MKKLLIVLPILAVAYLLFSWINKPSDGVSVPSTNEVASITPPDGWKRYADQQLGFSFYTPEEFIVEANGQYSVMAKHPTSQSKTGDVEFFYVSVVPQSLFGSETGEVYNYQKSFYEKLMGIGVGEIKNLSAIDGQKDWFMYERMGDETINGRVAKAYVNQRPWEFPAGMWEYRYIFNLKDKIILAGGYIVGGPSDTPLSLPVFQKILGTLVITK